MSAVKVSAKLPVHGDEMASRLFMELDVEHHDLIAYQWPKIFIE